MSDILITDFPMKLNGRWGACSDHIVIHGDGSVTDEKGRSIDNAKAVKVVRCRDCIHNNDCDIQASAQAGDYFFCGAGEAKDDVALVVRRYGKWTDYDDTEKFTARCSICGNITDTRFSMNYCSRCGAKMSVR